MYFCDAWKRIVDSMSQFVSCFFHFVYKIALLMLTIHVPFLPSETLKCHARKSSIYPVYHSQCADLLPEACCIRCTLFWPFNLSLLLFSWTFLIAFQERNVKFWNKEFYCILTSCELERYETNIYVYKHHSINMSANLSYMQILNVICMPVKMFHPWNCWVKL
jgi:hypothetical protein